MPYIAKHFVKLAGRRYTPGEFISDADAKNASKESLDWMLGIRAIVACAPDTEKTPWEERDADEDAEQEAPEEEEAPEIDAADGLIQPDEMEAVKPRGRKKK